MASLGTTELSMRSRGGGASQASEGAGLFSGGNGSHHHTQSGAGLSTLPPALGASLYDDGDDHRRKAAQMGLEQEKASGGGSSGVGGLLMGVTAAEARVLLGITLLALVVRLWKIGQPGSVVFDEVHFGGFASKYIKQKFFMDVHPPLAKMSIAFAGWLAGFDGEFDFKDIGKDYLNGEHTPVPYVAMRTLCALLGVATVPLAYLTLRGLGLRATTAVVGSVMVLFENALLTQSRYILLDSHLVFFTALTAYSWVGFRNIDRKPSLAFSRAWWLWLAGVGISLGCTVSVKWVGLLTIATIGLCTIVQLWGHLGNTRQNMKSFGQHFAARAACLIGLPIAVYLIAFAVHLGRLQRSGEGDGFMTSEFQHTLRGHGMRDTYADVSLGSTVTIRHVNTHGGYLHSHAHNYPGGSTQQQITLYPHVDTNNEWYIIKAPSPDEKIPVDKDGVPLTLDGPHDVEKHLKPPIEYLVNGMEVRFTHRLTDKRMHSHESHRPPITESDFQNEVTGYGFPGFAGDANDNWIVEIEQSQSYGKDSTKRVKALRTVFRLRHTLTGCYLFSHKITLPEWGFGQQEVTCNKQPTRPNTLWVVETNVHPLLESDPSTEMVNYRRPRFFEKFSELQKVMWETNAGLTDRHAYDSRPQHWLWFRRGINSWNKDHRQIYLTANPFVWLGSTAAIFAYFATRAFLMLRAKRGFKDFNDSVVVYYDSTIGFLVAAWGLHYAPFFLMSRQLFIHHYLPALYFSILVFATTFDLVTLRLRPRFRLQASAVMIALTVVMWWRYHPLSLAGEWTSSQCERARFRKTIDYDCVNFPADRSAYANFAPPIQTTLFIPPRHDAVTATSQKAVAPEPGRHAFENAPHKASDSGLAGGVPPAAASVQVEKPMAGSAQSPDVDPAAAAAANIVHAEGLNQQQFEKVVLGGTGEVAAASEERPAGGTAPTGRAEPASSASSQGAPKR